MTSTPGDTSPSSSPVQRRRGWFPSRSPPLRPLTTDEHLDDAVLGFSSADDQENQGPAPPPLPNARSSMSVDFQTRLNDEPPEHTFADLRAQRGAFSAIGAYSLSFLKNNWGILLFVAFMCLGLAMLGVFAFDPLPWQAWVSFGILVVVLALLITNTFSTEVTMLSGVTAMLLFKIITPDQALNGFANSGVAAVAVLFIVAEGIQRTSLLLPVFRIVLGKPRFLWEAQLRLMLPVAFFSAFLNNTPVVAMLIPVVQSWSRRAGFPISKLLMPLNNAAILGGTVTLLGTSTNLVVEGLAKENKLLGVDENGNAIGIGIFDISRIGLVMLAVGILYMLPSSRFLLRDRGQTGVGAMIRNPREYTVALLIQERSPIVGETVQEAGLRQLQGLFLVEITRSDGEVIPAVAPDTKLHAGDTLLFAGVVETVTELYHIQGLVPAAGQSQKMKLERHRRRLVELVISASSMLVGSTAKESKFRSRFSAAIIAVHRQGEHVKEKIADITLRPGDTLLVETGEAFIVRFGRDSNFALVSEVSGSQPPREDRLHMAIAATIAVGMIALVTAGLIPLLTAASAAALLMIATSCLSFRNAAQSVNMSVILTIAASFGVSKGMEESGAAKELAQFIITIFEGSGSLGLLFGIYIGTALLSAVITNNAAVSLMFPVIKNISNQAGSNVNIAAVLYTLMIGASSSFSVCLY